MRQTLKIERVPLRGAQVATAGALQASLAQWQTTDEALSQLAAGYMFSIPLNPIFKRNLRLVDVIHSNSASVALGTALLVLGTILLIFSRRIAAFWSNQHETPIPAGAYYFVRYLFGPILVLIAGVLVLSGILGVR